MVLRSLPVGAARQQKYKETYHPQGLAERGKKLLIGGKEINPIRTALRLRRYKGRLAASAGQKMKGRAQ